MATVAESPLVPGGFPQSPNYEDQALPDYSSALNDQIIVPDQAPQALSPDSYSSPPLENDVTPALMQNKDSPQMWGQPSSEQGLPQSTHQFNSDYQDVNYHNPVQHVQYDPRQNIQYNQYQHDTQTNKYIQENQYYQANHYPSDSPPDHPSYHHNAFHQTYKGPSIKYYKEKPQAEVITQPAPAATQTTNMGDAMGMMMMNQMMMQQMQSQQMQAAQMAAMNQQNMQMQTSQMQMLNQNGKGSCNSCQQSKQRGTVNIQTSKQNVKSKYNRPRGARPVQAHKSRAFGGIIPPLAVHAAEQGPQMTLDTVALDNWQEATIILCFAAVGLIYLMCSRAGGEEKKKEDLAKKHMS